MFKVGEDSAVVEGDDAEGVLGHVGVVGDHEDGAAAAVGGGGGDLFEDFGHVLGVGFVEVAGGFVGEEDGGVVGEGAGDGDALLFAAGEIGGAAVGFGFEADLGEQFLGADAALAAGEAAEFEHREGDVFFGGEFRQQEMELKDEADGLIAHGGEGGVGHLGDGAVVDEDFAVGGAVEAAEEVKEGWTCRSRRRRRWRRIGRGGYRGRAL